MSGGCARTFTTIITDANATMTELHDRMPTILESSDGAEHDLATLLRPSGNVRWDDVGDRGETVTLSAKPSGECCLEYHRAWRSGQRRHQRR
jgi:hypothetical protein